jgi:hypothetical protein
VSAQQLAGKQVYRLPVDIADINNASAPLNDRTDKRITSLFQRMEQLSDKIENTVRTPKSKFGGEQYLTNKEVIRLLKISQRLLQNYRTEGKVPFYRVGGKVLYRTNDIELFLENHSENKQANKRFTHI